MHSRNTYCALICAYLASQVDFTYLKKILLTDGLPFYYIIYQMFQINIEAEAP